MGVEKEGEMRKYMSAHDTYYAYVRKDTANEKWLWLSPNDTTSDTIYIYP